MSPRERYGYGKSGLNLIAGDTGEVVEYFDTPVVKPITENLGTASSFTGKTTTGNGNSLYSFSFRESELLSTSTGFVLLSADVIGTENLPTIEGLTPVSSQTQSDRSFSLYKIDSEGLNKLSLDSSGEHSLELGIAGDVNSDNAVDGKDSQLVTKALGTVRGEADYDATLDINRDGAIDATDAQIQGSNYGFRYNQAPIVTDSEALTHEDLSIEIPLSDLASDPEGDRTFFRATEVENGTVSFSPDGQTAIFKPDVGYTGTASFKLFADDGYAVSDASIVEINVSDAPLTGIDFVERNPELEVGEQVELQVVADFADQQDVIVPGDYLNWSSENAGVASVSDRGVVTGVSNGTTIFTAQRDGIEAVTATRIGQAEFPTTEAELNTAVAEYYGLDVYPDAVTLTPDVERQIIVGIEGQTDSTDLSDDATGTRYFVDNPEVISINEDGLITTFSEGEASVTVIHGGTEAVIPVNVETANLGATELGADGGIVENSDGYQVMIPEGALAQATDIDITSVEQSELTTPLPDQFEVIDAFNLDLGEQELAIPGQLALPAPEGLEPGTEVFFMRDGELPDETGTWNPIWMVQESGIVGDDGMIRTSSPPWPAVSEGGDYIVTVPKVAYSVGKAYGAFNTLTGANSSAGVAGISAGVGVLGAGFGMVISMPIFSTEVSQSVEVITIPKIGTLPFVTTAGVELNPRGIPTANVVLDNPSTLVDNDPYSPPVLEEARFDFNEIDNVNEPIVYLTGSNFLINTSVSLGDINRDGRNVIWSGDDFDDLTATFYYGQDSEEDGVGSYEGEIIRSLSRELGNNRYEVAVKVPQTVALGNSSIELTREQTEIKRLIPFERETVSYSSDIDLTVKPTNVELTLAAQAFSDKVLAFNALSEERALNEGETTVEDIIQDPRLTSHDLLLASIPIGTGGDFDDDPRGLVATKDATRAYVALRESGSIAVVDLMTLQQIDTNPNTPNIVEPIEIPGYASTGNIAPYAVTTSSDDRYLYVGDYNSSVIYIIDIDPNSERYHQLTQTISLGDGGGVRSLAVNSDGTKLFATVPGRYSQTEVGKIYAINIDPAYEPGESEPDNNNYHELIGSIEVEKGVEGISATPDPKIMTFTNRNEDFKGFGLLNITSEDPGEFAADVSYTSLGLGKAIDYFDVNDARDVVITSDGKYGFVAGFNGRNFGSGIPSIDGPRSGSNVGIIVDPLTENAKLVAATRPIPMGLTTSLSISGDDKYLFAAYPGAGGVFAWDVEEMIATLENPSPYKIDHRGYGIASPTYNPNTSKNASKADFSSVPIDNINPDITIASDLQVTKDTFRFNGFEFVNDVEFGVPDDSKRAPLTVGFNPWSITGASYRDWLKLKNEQWKEIEYKATSDDEGNVTIEPNWLDSTFVDTPIPPDSLDEVISTLGVETLPELESIFVPTGEKKPPKTGIGTGLIIGVGLAVLTWIITTSDVVEVELNISTSPSGEGLFSEEDGFVQRPPASGIREDDLKTTEGGIDDYNPNRVYSAKWIDAGLGNGKGNWIVNGETIAALLPATVFPFAHLLNLTSGQKYYYGVRAKSQTKGWETESGGDFTLPLANIKGRNLDGTPLPFDDKAFSSVTFITPEASAFDPQGFDKANAIAQKITRDIEGDADGEETVNGTILKYDPNTGKWEKISGDRGLGRPLVLIADWSQDSVARNYNSGFAEGAADSLFASLVSENSIFEELNKDALFNSPFHFIGMGRGAVVNSEIIQRLGTYYPKPAEPDNPEDPNYDNRNLFPDLQMTTIDPNDFDQSSLSRLPFNNYYDPTIHVWDNVTYADNYYQTASSANPRGRHLINLIPEDLLPPDTDNFLNEPDLSLNLGGYFDPDGGGSNELYEFSRVGFTPDTFEQSANGENPHNRTNAWYGGTANVSWNKDDNPFDATIHRRKGDFSYSELDPNSDYLNPWYTPTHTDFQIGDEDAQCEGIGTGWYYSPQGGGYNRRALTLNSPQSVSLSNNSTRTPLEHDNTHTDELVKGKMRGDFAVPTLFNGNFDAIYAINDPNNQPIPGWSLHNGFSTTFQKALKTWDEIGVENSANYPDNYALELTSGQSITHNRFIVPDWGTLRFDLHVPNPSGGKLKAFIKGSDSEDIWQPLTPVELVRSEDPIIEDADGNRISNPNRPNNVGYYDYINGEYVDPYTYTIAYGEEGFETFHLDIPENLRGESAQIKFELEGNSTVYLDDVFFKSEHLKLGNPTFARPGENTHRENYLIEKPQFSLSYNDATKTPNWVSWQLDKSWLGNAPRPRSKEAGTVGYPPTDFPPVNDYLVTRIDYPWIPDSELLDRWIKTISSDYRSNNRGLEKGHITPVADRSRTNKDTYATFFTSNMLPQHGDNNRGPWLGFETDIRNSLTSNNIEQDYTIIAGGYDYNFNPPKIHNNISKRSSDGRIEIDSDGIWTQNPKNISIPNFTWKIVVPLEQGQNISDITSDTEVVAVMIPNKQKRTTENINYPLPGETSRLIRKWNFWQDWRVSIDYIENLTGYDFLSELPDQIEEAIESRGDGLLPSSASLMADDNHISNSILNDIGNNFIVRQAGLSQVATTKFVDIDNSISKNTTSKKSFSKENASEISLFQHRVIHPRLSKARILEVDSIKNRVSDSSMIQVNPAKNRIAEINIFNDSIRQSSTTQINTTQIDTKQTSLRQIDTAEVNSTQTNVLQLDTSQVDITEIPFTSSIPSKQFFSSHNSTPQIIDVLNNSATNIWSDLLQTETQLDIDFQITDLPTGQLAEATITDFDDSGVPNAGTIKIDHNANEVGWFIDETPLDNSEFIVQDTDSHLLAAAESEASGKYDLLTTVLHELAHLYGFIDGYEGFDERVETENGTTKFIGNDFEAVLDGEHLDKEAHPHDLLNTHLSPGMRKLPSELDVQILKALIATELDRNSNKPAGDELLASLTSDPLLAISNGDFSITDTTVDSFAWDTRGASSIENGQAVLTEDSPLFSNFTQTFTVPEDAKTVQFKLIGAELGASELLPPDAFEVALIDANTNQPLVSNTGLTQTDSLLNIQNDGTAYFSDKVRISGATSGEIIGLDKPRTVTVDISDLTPNTEATLYFDLLGFGAADSRVVIDDVRLSDQFLLPPVANDDTATVVQGETKAIEVLANDTDEDGTIATDSIQIASQPANGTVIVNNDGTVDYTPNEQFVGEDSFTYTVIDSDSQQSEIATVNVTVENAIPEINDLVIPENITEGDEIVLSAIAFDAGNDELTYIWEIDSQQLTVNSQQINYIFLDNGTYADSVTVTDTNGGTASQAFEVVVANAAPVVEAGTDKTVDEGSSVNLEGSFTDAGIEDTHVVAWDLGDGSTAETSETNHVYTQDGTYTATFTVTDNDGAVSSDTITVTVNNVAPTKR